MKNILIMFWILVFTFDLIAQTGSGFSKSFKLNQEDKNAILSISIEPKEIIIPAGEIKSIKLIIGNSSQATARNISSSLKYKLKYNGAPLVKVQYKLSKNNDWIELNNVLKIDIDSIPPGLKKEIEIYFKAQEDVVDQDFKFLFSLLDDSWGKLQPLSFNLKTYAIYPPVFLFSYSVIDAFGKEMNRRINPGETIELITKIKNSGDGEAKNVKATFSLAENESNLIIKGETNNIVLGNIASNTEKIIKILIAIGEKYNKNSISLNLKITEQREKYSMIQPVALFVSPTSANVPKPPSLSFSIEPKEIELESNENKNLKIIINNSGEEKATGVIARLEPGTTLTGINYDKIINVGEILPGIKKEIEINFQSSKDTKTQYCEFRVDVIEKKGFNADPQTFKLKSVVDITPPSILVLEPALERGKVTLIDKKELVVRVRAEDKNGISKVLINGIEARLSGNAEYYAGIKLDDSLNVITVIATDKKENQSYSTFFVLNKPPERVASIVRDGIDYGVFFAIDKYDHWNKLVNPINDARTLSEELKKSYQFKVDLSENATQTDILSKLREYALKTYADGDQLFIFFAGHGQFDDVFKEGFIVAKDSKENDEGRISYISHNRLRAQIDNIPCKHIFLVIDACFGGTFDPIIAQLDRGLDDYSEVSKTEFIQRKMKFKTRKFLTSGGKVYVSDGRPGQYSPFVRKFLEAIRSYGGKDGVLTLGEIINYIEKVKPEPRFGEFGSNEPGSDFIFIAK